MATQTIDETPTTADVSAPTTQRAPIQWRITLLVGVVTGLLWTGILLYGTDTIKLLAGIAPVIGGIFLGRKVKDRALVHGLIMALAAMAVALVIVGITLFNGPAQIEVPNPAPEGGTRLVSRNDQLISFGVMMLITLLPFPIYGTVLSVRTQKRNAEMRRETVDRGGQLQRAGRIVNVDDLQSLPLPKFAYWVAQLFKKNGFVLDDYRFDKDVVNLMMRRTDPEEKWLVRCTVADAIKPGLPQALAQDIRDSEYVKGVVVTSTKVQDGARKWAKGRRNIEVLDGETLIEID